MANHQGTKRSSSKHISKRTSAQQHQAVCHRFLPSIICHHQLQERYLMQHTFFPSHGPSRDRIFIIVNVTVGSMMPGSCDGSPLLDDTPTNFSFYQEFQWSRSPLLNLISVDQLLILDNVISENIYNTVQHHEFLHVSLNIDALPCNTSEDDLLKALMQLLPWVCTSVHACIIMICMDCTEMA